MYGSFETPHTTDDDHETHAEDRDLEAVAEEAPPTLNYMIAHDKKVTGSLSGGLALFSLGTLVTFFEKGFHPEVPAWEPAFLVLGGATGMLLLLTFIAICTTRSIPMAEEEYEARAKGCSMPSFGRSSS